MRNVCTPRFEGSSDDVIGAQKLHCYRGETCHCRALKSKTGHKRERAARRDGPYHHKQRYLREELRSRAHGAGGHSASFE